MLLLTLPTISASLTPVRQQWIC